MLMEDTYYEAYQDIESRKSECYCEKRVDAANVRHLASLHARLLVQ